MAQLSEDCFAFGGQLLGVDAALALIQQRVQPVVSEEMAPLAEACGRVPRPRCNGGDRCAAARQQRGRRLRGRACRFAARPGHGAAGDRASRRRAPLGHAARPGEAIRIFTGAPMPDGVDTVMMQEDCVVEEGRVRLAPGIKKGANRRHAGEDVAKGAVALATGRRLKPADLGLAAALGQDRLPVFRQLRVALLSTGDEVREPGQPLAPGMIYDANRVMLMALLQGLGCAVSDLGIRPDRAAALADTSRPRARGTI